VYDRTFDGQPHDFGVIGAVKGTLVLYDQQTKSRWSQLFGKAIEGPMAGRQMIKLPSTMTTWENWRRLHPATTVYVKPTAYSRRYTAENFEHIAQADAGPVRPEDLVVGLEGHLLARVYLVRRLAKERLVHDLFEETPILVYLSADYATARVYTRTVGEKVLHFTLTEDESLQDTETGSTWHPVTGVATAGPLQGQTMGSVVSTYSLWFAWHRYRPDTQVHDEPPEVAAPDG
jgi:hypothetical protein